MHFADWNLLPSLTYTASSFYITSLLNWIACRNFIHFIPRKREKKRQRMENIKQNYALKTLLVCVPGEERNASDINYHNVTSPWIHIYIFIHFNIVWLTHTRTHSHLHSQMQQNTFPFNWKCIFGNALCVTCCCHRIESMCLRMDVGILAAMAKIFRTFSDFLLLRKWCNSEGKCTGLGAFMRLLND